MASGWNFTPSDSPQASMVGLKNGRGSFVVIASVAEGKCFQVVVVGTENMKIHRKPIGKRNWLWFSNKTSGSVEREATQETNAIVAAKMEDPVATVRRVNAGTMLAVI